MGDVANDMVTGLTCSLCGTFFVKRHDVPVLCRSCWNDTSPDDRKTMAVQRAWIKEL